MDDGVITTATSQNEGRLKVGAGSMRKKKMNITKAAVKDFKNKKNDGKGGPGDPSGLSSPGYGAPNTTGMMPSPQSSSFSLPGNVLPSNPSAPTLGLSNKNSGFKMLRPLKMKGFPKAKISPAMSSIKGLKKKLKF